MSANSPIVKDIVLDSDASSCVFITIIYSGRYWGQYCGNRIESVGVLGFDKFRGGVFTCQTRLIALESKPIVAVSLVVFVDV